jgi:hypothetical protein
MRALIVALLLFSLPAAAADYTPWPGQEAVPQFSLDSIELAQNGRSCCRHCSKSEQPCGSKCIPMKDTCTTKPGCACSVDGYGGGTGYAPK